MSATKRKLAYVTGEIGEVIVNLKGNNKKKKGTEEDIKKKIKDKRRDSDRRSASGRRRSKAEKSENSTQTTVSLRKLKKNKVREKPSVASSGSKNAHLHKNATRKKTSFTSCLVKNLSRSKEAHINRRHENCFKDSIINPTNSFESNKACVVTPVTENRIKSGSGSCVKGTCKTPTLRTNQTPSTPTYTPASSKSHLSNFTGSTTSSETKKNTSIIVVNSHPVGSGSLIGRRYMRKPRVLSGEDLLKLYREQVDRAIKDRKTFSISGSYWAVRKALISRGWVEKIVLNYSQPDKENIRKLTGLTFNELVENIHDKTNGHLCKRVIMSKMIGTRHQVDLYWDYGSDAFKANPDNVKLTLINSVRRGLYSYTSKNGLCELMKQSHWYNYPGIAYIRHPRSYSLTENGDPDDFVKDFKITSVVSLLKWIVFTSENSISKIMSDAGKVPIKTFHFAMKECEKFIQKFKHEDIDYTIQEALEIDWNQFLDSYYRCVHVGNHFRTCEAETEQSLVHKSRIMINKMKRILPFIDMDGFMNIWILKPTAGSRGIGIHICRTLGYVLRVVSERKTSKYVIQKYIERPLLIYNTKFDIRQWFLISSTSPLTIWIYRACYLRFSSQTYNLRKLHESIHLTNNSVQCKYKNSNRDPALPEYNMWDSNKFKSYLEMIGYPNVYNEIIYPGMKECITAAVLIHQDYINTRRNCFELYGADFMLTEDFKPWLIEINSRPALYASTPITTKMCPQVLEDVIKVIIDRARNPQATTGLFELLYKENLYRLPPLDTGLQLQGKPLPHEFFYTPLEENTSSLQPENYSSDIININNTQNYIKYITKQMKKTLENLLDIIHKERQRRQKLKSKRSNLTVQNANKLPIDLEKDSIQYIENINKVNENIKEIQQIIKPKLLSDKKLNDIVASIEIKKKQLTNETSVEDVGNDKKKYYLPHQTDEELNKERQKIEDALVKMEENKTSTRYLADFIKYLNIWGKTAAEKMN